LTARRTPSGSGSVPPKLHRCGVSGADGPAEELHELVDAHLDRGRSPPAREQPWVELLRHERVLELLQSQSTIDSVISKSCRCDLARSIMADEGDGSVRILRRRNR
jgi:hypothetical protein